MPAIDMTHIYGNRTYKGNWVAIIDFETKPQVVAHAKTLHEVLVKAKKKGFELPLVTRIPMKVLPMVGRYFIE